MQNDSNLTFKLFIQKKMSSLDEESDANLREREINRQESETNDQEIVISSQESVISSDENPQEIEYEIIAGQRKNSKLLWSAQDKFLYVRNTFYNGRRFYMCRKNRSCKSRVYVIEETGKCYKYDILKEHDNSNDEEEFQKLTLTNKIKQGCSEMQTSAHCSSTTIGS